MGLANFLFAYRMHIHLADRSQRGAFASDSVGLEAVGLLRKARLHGWTAVSGMRRPLAVKRAFDDEVSYSNTMRRRTRSVASGTYLMISSPTRLQKE